MNYAAMLFIATTVTYLLAGSYLDPRLNYDKTNPRLDWDSINAQLTNVREMLATLTGAAVAAAGTPAEDEPISRGVPAQQSR